MDATVSISNSTFVTSNEGCNVFSIDVRDKANLFQIYMPFINNGGLFVRTDKQFNLGDEVSLLVKLIDEPESYAVRGKVAWITPRCAQGGRVAGIGVQFGEDTTKLRAKIETFLAGALTADRMTDTM